MHHARELPSSQLGRRAGGQAGRQTYRPGSPGPEISPHRAHASAAQAQGASAIQQLETQPRPASSATTGSLLGLSEPQFSILRVWKASPRLRVPPHTKRAPQGHDPPCVRVAGAGCHPAGTSRQGSGGQGGHCHPLQAAGPGRACPAAIFVPSPVLSSRPLGTAWRGGGRRPRGRDPRLGPRGLQVGRCGAAGWRSAQVRRCPGAGTPGCSPAAWQRRPEEGLATLQPS